MESKKNQSYEDHKVQEKEKENLKSFRIGRESTQKESKPKNETGEEERNFGKLKKEGKCEGEDQ